MGEPAVEAIERPPIRYSIGQPDYDHSVGMRLRIFLDGVEQERVVAYDCEAGTVLRYKLDVDGRIQLNKDRAEALRETVTGEVTVDWRDG